MNENLIGATIHDRYTINAQIGFGGMGLVYKASQLGLARSVAIKILHPLAVDDKDSNERFLREGQHLSALSHPHIISFYQFGFWRQKQPYIVMELVDGEDLRKLLDREAQLPWQRALGIVLQVCDAMAYAHSQEVINRDLKPQNIMLSNSESQDFVKIIDFGLARLSESSAQDAAKLTQTGNLVGTATYMSPEQCRGEICTKQSDIYSLGCVLYEMLAGTPPYQADSAVTMLYKHSNEFPERLSSIMPEKISLDLEKCVFKALAKDLQERYQSMDDFAGDLRLLLEDKGQQVSAETHLLHAKKTDSQLQTKQMQLRILMPVLGVICLLGVFVAFSDPGIAVIQASYFENSKDPASVKQCLAEAARSLSVGHKSAAIILCRSAVSRLPAFKVTQFEEAKFLAKAASIALSSDDKTEAGEWAIKSLQIMLKVLSKNYSPEQFGLPEQEAINTDCAVLMKCESRLIAPNETSISTLLQVLELKTLHTVKPKLALGHLLLHYHKLAHRLIEQMRDKIRIASFLLRENEFAQSILVLNDALNTSAKEQVISDIKDEARNVLESVYVQTKQTAKLQDMLNAELRSPAPNKKLVKLLHRELGKLYLQKCDYESVQREYGSLINLIMQSKSPDELEIDGLVFWYGFSMLYLNRSSELEIRIANLMHEWNHMGYPHSASYFNMVVVMTDALKDQKKDSGKFLKLIVADEKAKVEPNFPLLAFCFDHLGRRALEKGDIVGASRDAQDMIANSLRAGKNRFSSGWASGNTLLADCYLIKNRTADAIDLLNKSISELRSERVQPILETISLSACLSKAYLRQDRNLEAVDCLIHEKSYCDSFKTKGDYVYAQLIRSLALTYLKVGREADAIKMLQKHCVATKDSAENSATSKLLAHKLLEQIFAAKGLKSKSDDEAEKARKLAASFFNGAEFNRQAIEVLGAQYGKVE